MSRYFYELMKFLTTVPDARTDLLLGINGTVYPFGELASSRARVTGFPRWLPPGALRYVVNEVWSNLAAPWHGKMDIYHPTNYLLVPMVRSRRVVATHHDCTHERFPQMFPDARKVFWARKRLLPKMDAIICVSESNPPGPASLLQRGSGQDLRHTSWAYRVAPQPGGGCRTARTLTARLHPVCWNEARLQEL